MTTKVFFKPPLVIKFQFQNDYIHYRYITWANDNDTKSFMAVWQQYILN